MERRPALVREVAFSRDGVDGLVDELRTVRTGHPPRGDEYLLDYPTVYLVHETHGHQYDIYVGETSDIRSRTLQHLHADAAAREDWKALATSGQARMFVIGHPYFNKSLTLDIENRMMQCLLGNERVRRIYNRRTNPQSRYFTSEAFEPIFVDVWSRLRHFNRDLFLPQRLLEDSALFKASPFHKLTPEQLDAKRRIFEATLDALSRNMVGALVLVEGAAGTGKTVLLSSLFYELFHPDPEDLTATSARALDAHIVVNHDQHQKVYEQIATKLGLMNGRESRVSKPTAFINHRSPSNPVDVVLVDEAHLLWTQGKQSYRGQNQLQDLLARARVVIAIFDPQQILATNQHWEERELTSLREVASEVIQLKNQMRVRSSESTWRWIRALIDENRVLPRPPDPSYEIRIFDDPRELHQAIRAKNRSQERGLSRVLATFDWPFTRGSLDPQGRPWGVEIGTFRAPWNLRADVARPRGLGARLSWAEDPQSVDEIGSHFTIQGFDLNFAGVILGPSVKLRDGRIVHDSSASANRQVRQRRTLSDGTRANLAEQLLSNEMNVLLTRGVHGLYIYACDDELRAELLRSGVEKLVGS